MAGQSASEQQTIACLRREARKITDSAIADVASRESWEKVRAKKLEELRDMLGLLPWPKRTPLNVRVTGKLDYPEYTVEKIAFESMPKIYVTTNLYIPKVRKGKAPAIIYVCGHSYSPYGDKVQYQRHGISLAKNGYVAMVIDSIQIAETFSLHHGTYSLDMFDWYARGYSPAGVEVWNAMRAIDYLETRPEVDATRIGMTGRSGGAGMSWFTAAVDPRIKSAAPVMGISTYAVNLERNTQRLHCDCMFPVNFLRQDLIHLGALISPRALLMAHGRKDELFPMQGVMEFEQKIGGLYRSYHRADSFKNVIVETAHQDSDFLREEIIRWFDTSLLNTPNRKLDMAYQNAPPESLAVFPDGAPKDALNYRVHEILIRTPPYQPARKKELLTQLRDKTFDAFPKGPGVPVTRRIGDELELESEQGVPVRLIVKKSSAVKGPLPAILYVASDGDDDRSLVTLLNSIRNTDAVKAIVFPRGVGEIGWNRTVWRDMMRNAMHVGRSVDSMRLWDVMQAVRALRADPAVDPKRIVVAGAGVSAGLALYSAILDPLVEQVILLRPPSSHTEGPFFLNILRYTDLPEAASLIAPRRVNFYNVMPPAYKVIPNGSVTMSLAGPLLHRYDHDFSSGW